MKGGINKIKLDTLTKEIESNIKNELLNIIKFDELNIPFKEESINMSAVEHISKSKAYKCYMNNKEIDTTEYADFYSNDDFDSLHESVVDFLLNPENFIHKKAVKYISDNSQSLVQKIRILKMSQTKLKELMKNQVDNAKKNMLKVLTTNMNTVQLEILKDGQKFSLK